MTLDIKYLLGPNVNGQKRLILLNWKNSLAGDVASSGAVKFAISVTRVQFGVFQS